MKGIQTRVYKEKGLILLVQHKRLKQSAAVTIHLRLHFILGHILTLLYCCCRLGEEVQGEGVFKIL